MTPKKAVLKRPHESSSTDSENDIVGDDKSYKDESYVPLPSSSESDSHGTTKEFEESIAFQEMR